MQIIIKDEKEIWKSLTYPTVRTDCYMINNYGHIFSKITNRILTNCIDSKGYLRVMLTRNNTKGHTFKVHRLVAWEFCEGYSDIKNEVNHKDSIRTNCYYNNLEWITSKDNSIHAFADGLRKPSKGELHYANKYPIGLIKHIKTLLLNDYSTIDIMNYFGYTYSKDNLKLSGLISDIKKNKVWKDVKGSTTIEKYYIYIE